MNVFGSHHAGVLVGQFVLKKRFHHLVFRIVFQPTNEKYAFSGPLGELLVKIVRFVENEHATR